METLLEGSAPGMAQLLPGLRSGRIGAQNQKRLSIRRVLPAILQVSAGGTVAGWTELPARRGQACVGLPANRVNIAYECRLPSVLLTVSSVRNQ